MSEKKMNILAIESSGLVASAAVAEDGLLKTEFTINNRLTHSETLLPMIRSMFDISGLDMHKTDAIAVSAGPGSFTGLRIGAATAKGLALALNIPVISVSSLKAMAYGLSELSESVICPIMDARREQVYSAAYRHGEELLTEEARDIHEFLAELDGFCNAVDTSNKHGCGGKCDNELDQAYEKSEDAYTTDNDASFADIETVKKNDRVNPARAHRTFIFVGDGVPVYRDIIAKELHGNVTFAGASFNRQRAANVAELGASMYEAWLKACGLTAEEVRLKGADSIDCYDGNIMNSDDFAPTYLRKTQAEREMAEGKLEDAGRHSLSKMQDKGRPRKA